jgi:hypothetical protein
MYHTVPLFETKQPAPEELARILADLGQNEAEAIVPALTLMQEHPGLLEQSSGQALLAPLLKAAMGPLEREGEWAPMALLLRSLDDKGAAIMEDVLLPAHTVIDPATLPDSTVVVLAGLIDAAGRPGKALALLDGLEATRGNPRFMTLCWQARCHILGVSDAIDALWPGMAINGTGMRAQARHHAQARRMGEALQAFSAALAQASTPAAQRGIGADLAVLAAWLHGHGQGDLLERHRALAGHLADHPALAREALDLLLRAPACRAWEPMRESWLEAARCYFQRALPRGRLPQHHPHEYLTRRHPMA